MPNFLYGQSSDDANNVAPELQEDTGYKNAQLRILDLASFDSVKAFAQQIEEEEDRLDILVENAGILPDSTFKPTKDGWEPT